MDKRTKKLKIITVSDMSWYKIKKLRLNQLIICVIRTIIANGNSKLK